MQGFRALIYGSAAIAAATLAGCASRTPSPAPPPPPPATAPAPATTPPAATTPPPLPVRHPAPFRYTVKKGDTLWGISQHFFDSPWLWPEVWYENPWIHNPHLIYPGDVITLTTVGGRPVLTIMRGSTVVRSTSPAMKERMLKPQIVRTPLEQAVPTIPYEEIATLLSKPRVMGASQYHDAAYVLRPIDGRMLAAAPSSIYVRGISPGNDTVGTDFALVRKHKELRDPVTGDVLGYEVLYLGRGIITATGDPSTLKLKASTREIVPGDRLVPIESGVVPAQFPLLTPKSAIKGEIIDVIGGLREVGQYQVVVLDRGSQNGLKTGDVLAVMRPGKRVHDPYARGSLSSSVSLPEQRTGELVVFRTFPRASYALVMRATQPVRIGYHIANP